MIAIHYFHLFLFNLKIKVLIFEFAINTIFIPFQPLIVFYFFQIQIIITVFFMYPPTIFSIIKINIKYLKIAINYFKN